jgi:hypothetical protein
MPVRRRSWNSKPSRTAGLPAETHALRKLPMGLRALGSSWREIAARLGADIGTVHRVAQGHFKSFGWPLL